MLDLETRFSARIEGVCSIAAAVSGAAMLGSAAIGAVGTNAAANTAANAQKQAANTQLSMFNQTRQSLAPFVQTGTGALSQLANLWGIGPGGTAGGGPNAAAAMSQLTQFPGYQFGLSQGIQGLDRSAASRGLTLSGAQLKGAQQYGTDYAMQQAWQPYVSQLNTLSSLGENAAAMTGNAGAAAAQAAGGYQAGAGIAQAGGQVQTSNILGQALQQGAGMYNQYAGGGYATPGFDPGVGFGSGAGNLTFNPTDTSGASWFPA